MIGWQSKFHSVARTCCGLSFASVPVVVRRSSDDHKPSEVTTGWSLRSASVPRDCSSNGNQQASKAFKEFSWSVSPRRFLCVMLLVWVEHPQAPRLIKRGLFGTHRNVYRQGLTSRYGGGSSCMGCGVAVYGVQYWGSQSAPYP